MTKRALSPNAGCPIPKMLSKGETVRGVIVCCSWILSVGINSSAVGEPFTVADSIAMTRLADPDLMLADFGAEKFKVSPDRRHVAIVTRRGNLETGRNEYALGQLDVDAILRYVNSRTAVDRPTINPLVEFETSATWPAVDAVQWLPDSRRIAFIGRNIDQLGQVFVYDLESRKLTQLTQHPNNVVRFALSDDARTLVYSAHAYPDWSSRNAHGYVVQSQWVASLALRNPADGVAEVRHFVVGAGSDVTREIGMEPSRYPTDIAISPSGRKAVTIGYLQSMPSGWSNYDFVRKFMRRPRKAGAVDIQDESASLPALVWDNDAFGGRSDWLTQPMLIDLVTGKAQPLFDAPLTTAAVFVTTRWSKDNRRILIGPTYMPLTVDEEQERARRRRFEVIAEVELSSGKVTRVADIPAGMRLTGFDWFDDSLVVAQFVNARGGPPPFKYFRKRNGLWIEEKNPARAPTRIRLSIVQNMNEPYEIAAEDTRTGRKRVVTELNPQLRNLTLGRVEIFEWPDRLGRTFQGGLVYPPGYESGTRYPVVIQGGAFNPSSFLVDGPPGLQGASAAQALANNGMLVLQLPLHETSTRESGGTQRAPCVEWEDCGENPRWMAMLEGAIDGLDASGRIDRSRVGVIGFSRIGMFVQHAITFSHYPIAAATICDSIAATPFAYTMVYGFSYPGMLEFEDESEMGAPFWGKGIKLWQERSPAFHLDRINSPLRVELIGRGISAYWDTFAILKRQRRPVELIHMPLDTHNLQTPFARYTSKQGNVDWFRFWLKDEEDIDPDKVEQYVRWRKLRQQRDHDLSRHVEQSSSE